MTEPHKQEPTVNTPENSEPNSEPLRCDICAALVTAQNVNVTVSLRFICNACADKRAAADRAEDLAARLDGWRSICPPEYQATDLNHPSITKKPKERDTILKWPFPVPSVNPRAGLLIHGPSRRCKTRLAWLLVKRLILAGRSVHAVTAHKFGITCSDAHANGWALEWFNSMTRPDVLFIDDLGVEKETDRVEADLLAVIEHRGVHHKPILTTMNAKDRHELKTHFSPKRQTQIVERLCEFCTPIAL